MSDSEIRVLRYLPTNLTAPEIASELYVSRHTVKTHMRHLYAKLGTHRRADTVARPCPRPAGTLRAQGPSQACWLIATFAVTTNIPIDAVPQRDRGRISAWIAVDGW